MDFAQNRFSESRSEVGPCPSSTRTRFQARLEPEWISQRAHADTTSFPTESTVIIVVVYHALSHYNHTGSHLT